MIARRITLVAATCLAAPLCAQLEPRTRGEIIAYAATAPTSPYVFGGSTWDPDDRNAGGCDCSGLVGKAWALPRWVPYRERYHPYATVHFIETPGPYWYEVSRGDLLTGDAIVWRYADNSGGHMYVYEAGDGWGSHRTYEAASSSIGIVHRWRNPPSSYSRIKGIRRTALVENVGVSDVIVESDDGAPAFVYAGSPSSSGYDSYAHFLDDGSCRYTFVGPGTADTATFTPALPRIAFYRVFVTCNQATANVSGVDVTVDHAHGQSTFTWDQSSEGLNEWLPVAGPVLMGGAHGGSVVWDASTATPRDGSRIFRADATMFRLSNEVVVDGIGAEPGTFPNVSSALQWLRANPSLDPDVIRITTDHVAEPYGLSVAIGDDLRIEGDADGNGTPCTLVVPPHAVSGFGAAGVHLVLPRQHTWHVEDLVIVPPHTGPGVATGAAALVVGSEDTSQRHHDGALVLERVTLTGSLAGDVPAGDDADRRALCTQWGGGSGSEVGVLVRRGASDAGDGNWNELTLRDVVVSQGATTGVAISVSQLRCAIEGECRIGYNRGSGIALLAGTGGEATIDGCRVFGNDGGSTQAGLESWCGVTVRDSIFAFNGRYNWYHRGSGSAASPQTVLAERCTFHDAVWSADTSPLCVSGAANHCAVLLRDCVLSGSPAPGQLEAVFVGTTSTGTAVTLDHCALVTAGPHALSGDGVREGASLITQIGTVTGDPDYASLDPLAKMFVAVRSAGYATAASDGGPLTGGGASARRMEIANYGAGCPGSFGLTPVIWATDGTPFPGNSAFRVWLRDIHPLAAGHLLVGLSNTFAPVANVPLPLDLGLVGFGGCTLLTDLLPAGAASKIGTLGWLDLPIPAALTWQPGGGIYLQWLVLDPGAPAGICFSDGLAAEWPL